MYPTDEIRNYIVYLKRHCGLSVTIHPLKKENVIVPGNLMGFNIHENSYCIYIKTFPQARAHCVAQQKKVLEKCKGGAFFGSCYAGVMEYVYPIIRSDQTIGFISVSGYRSPDGLSKMESISKKYAIPFSHLLEIYENLRPKLPPKEEIDTLIYPLCRMLELAYLKTEAETGVSEKLTDRVIRYVKTNYMNPLTLDVICSRYSCSRSHISHCFRKQTGCSFREFLTDVRLENAKTLLRYSELTVTEIAFSVGFNDSNYFSNVFKTRVGVSPKGFRKGPVTAR